MKMKPIIPTFAPDRTLMPRLTRGTFAVLGATVAMALGFGSLGLPSVFMGSLEAEFAWSRSDTSFVYGIASIGMAVGGVFWGRLADRLDLRLMLVVGGTGMATALLAMAAVQSLWQIYLASAILGGLGFSVLYAPALAAPGEWYPNQRGLVTGTVTAGGALGQGFLPYIGRALIDALGWRLAYLCLGLAMLAILAAVLPLIRWPDGYKTDVSVISRPTDRLYDHQVRRVALLGLAAFLCCACMGVPLVHLASLVGTVCGSATFGAACLLVAMVCGAIGRVFFGLLADRSDALASYALASFTQTLCVVAYPFLETQVPFLLLSAVFGFGFAGNMTCLILCVRNSVPANRFGGAIGAVMLVAWIGMGSGSFLGGWLFDSNGSYTSSFVMAGVTGVLNLFAIFAIREMGRSRRIAMSV